MTTATVGPPEDDELSARIQSLRKRVAEARKVGDPDVVRESLVELANALVRFATVAYQGGHLRLALVGFEELLEIAREIDDRRNEAAFLDNIGMVHDDLGDPGLALRSFELALSICRETDDLRGEAIALNNIGMVHDDLGDSGLALRFFELALSICQETDDLGGVATNLEDIGGVYRDLRDPERALVFYEQALPIFRETADLGGEATTLNSIGLIHKDLGNPARALGFFEKALPIFREEGDRGGEPITLNIIGQVHDDLGDPGQGLFFFEQALAIFRETGDLRGEATTLNSIGGVHNYLGDPEQGLFFFEQALAIFRETGDLRGEATTLNNIGGVHADLGDPARALGFHEQALLISRETGGLRGEATTLNNIGVLHLGLGDPARALEFFMPALQMFRESDDLRGEATTLNSIGGVRKEMGDLERALGFYEQALLVSRETGDLRGEATTLDNIGGVHADLGDPARALGFHEQALLISRETDDLRGEATTLNNIGVIHKDLGDPERALELYEQALLISRETSDLRGEATTLNNIGVLHLGLGDPARALVFFEQALPVSRETGDRLGDATALNNIGMVHADLGDPARALGFYEQALLISREKGDRPGEATTLNNMAFSHMSLGNVKEALAGFRESMRLKESMRSDVKDDDHRLSFFSTQVDTYTAFTDFLVSEAADPESEIHELLDDPVGEALRVADRSRARVFLELLSKSVQEALAESETDLSPEGEALVRPGEVLPSSDLLLAIRDQLLADGKTVLLEYVLAEKNSILFVVTRKDFEVIATLPPKSVIEEMVRELRAFAACSPEMGGAHATRSYPNGKELFDVLIRPALEFKDTNGNVKPLIKDGDELLIAADGVLNLLPFPLLLTDAPVRAKDEGTSNSTDRMDAGGDRGEGGEGESVTQIPAAFEAEERLDELSRSLRAADWKDGPFDFRNLAYLTRSFRVRQIASAQSAIEAAKAQDGEGPSGTVALFAAPLDSVQGTDEPGHLVGDSFSPVLDASLNAIRSELLSLEHAAAEIQDIEQVIREKVPGLSFTPEPNLAATRTAVLNASGGPSRIVHFSCHGLINNETPELSGLIFEPDGDEPFTVFTASEILQSGIDSELTVLSACDTGHGKIVEGEGAIALTRSFLAGGSRSVVASLWKVPDEATRELMKLFYANLAAGLDRTDALSQAQISLGSSGRFDHPAFWAAFSLTGAGGLVIEDR